MRLSVYVCVFGETEGGRESVCLFETEGGERERVCLCETHGDRERLRESVCVCVRPTGTEGD